MLGFTGSEVTATIAELFGLPVKRGFLIEEVLPGSPAQAAGLRAGSRMVSITDKPYVLGGDIIVAVDGEPFTSAAQLAQFLLRSRPGQQLRLTVFRQGRTIDVDLPLEKMHMEF
jgi:putative serine protease PepD